MNITSSGARNLAVSLLNGVLLVPQFAVGWFFFWGYPLLRRCMRCGYRFAGPLPFAPDFDECAQCSYNLTGNVSGVCPECGWKLPRRYRQYRAKIDRSMSSSDRTDPRERS